MRVDEVSTDAGTILEDASITSYSSLADDYVTARQVKVKPPPVRTDVRETIVYSVTASSRRNSIQVRLIPRKRTVRAVETV